MWPVRPQAASVHTALQLLNACPPSYFYLVKHIGHVLLAAGLLGVAELGGVLARQQALVTDQRHALIGHLVPFEVDLVVGTPCKRQTFRENPPKDMQGKSVSVTSPLERTEQTNS